MNYILENEQEASRLERQSMSTSYSISKELEGLVLKENSKVLEIGCGAGTLINYLNSQYEVEAQACDLQPEHIEHCRENSPKNIHFFQHNILTQSLTEKYDYIFMRYVTHHLGAKSFEASLGRIKKALTPAGKVIIIDVDGLMLNLGTLNLELERYFEKINRKFSGDLNMGRKIPTILSSFGFTNIDYSIQTVKFSSHTRDEEKEQWRERMSFAKDSFINILGSELDFKRFQKIFFAELDNEAVPFFLNKFITIAQND